MIKRRMFEICNDIMIAKTRSCKLQSDEAFVTQIDEPVRQGVNSMWIGIVPSFQPEPLIDSLVWQLWVCSLFFTAKTIVFDMESPLFPAGLFICSLVLVLSSSSCLCLAALEQGQETPAVCVSYPF